ncbi:cytidine deaminase-like protein [Aureobasidium subglaciale]|nr:cytidine deaminase-like protein [Aureobasidium subglaciale]
MTVFPPRPATPTLAQQINHLEACLSLQTAGVEQHAKRPFAALLVSPTNEILLTHLSISHIEHAESSLALLASKHYSSAYLWTCTLYTTWEPCAMCTGTIYWANIGSVVYAAEEKVLKEITGEGNEENFTMSLGCREVFKHGQKDVKVFGPVMGMREKVVKESDRFWKPIREGLGQKTLYIKLLETFVGTYCCASRKHGASIQRKRNSFSISVRDTTLAVAHNATRIPLSTAGLHNSVKVCAPRTSLGTDHSSRGNLICKQRMANNIWTRVGACRKSLLSSPVVSKLFFSSHPILTWSSDPVKKKLEVEKYKEYRRQRRQTDPEYATRLRQIDLKYRQQHQQMLRDRWVDFYHADNGFRAACRLDALVRKNQWVRECLPWKPYRPVLYKEKVKHTCSTCLITRLNGFKLWWKELEFERYQCHRCYCKRSEHMPEGYEGIMDLKGLRRRKEELGH